MANVTFTDGTSLTFAGAPSQQEVEDAYAQSKGLSSPPFSELAPSPPSGWGSPAAKVGTSLAGGLGGWALGTALAGPTEGISLIPPALGFLGQLAASRMRGRVEAMHTGNPQEPLMQELKRAPWQLAGWGAGAGLAGELTAPLEEAAASLPPGAVGNILKVLSLVPKNAAAGLGAGLASPPSQGQFAMSPDALRERAQGGLGGLVTGGIAGPIAEQFMKVYGNQQPSGGRLNQLFMRGNRDLLNTAKEQMADTVNTHRDLLQQTHENIERDLGGQVAQQQQATDAAKTNVTRDLLQEAAQQVQAGKNPRPGVSGPLTTWLTQHPGYVAFQRMAGALRSTVDPINVDVGQLLQDTIAREPQGARSSTVQTLLQVIPGLKNVTVTPDTPTTLDPAHMAAIGSLGYTIPACRLLDAATTLSGELTAPEKSGTVRLGYDSLGAVRAKAAIYRAIRDAAPDSVKPMIDEGLRQYGTYARDGDLIHQYWQPRVTGPNVDVSEGVGLLQKSAEGKLPPGSPEEQLLQKLAGRYTPQDGEHPYPTANYDPVAALLPHYAQLRDLDAAMTQAKTTNQAALALRKTWATHDYQEQLATAKQPIQERIDHLTEQRNLPRYLGRSAIRYLLINLGLSGLRKGIK